MGFVTVRELSDNLGEVLKRVAVGECFVVTRDGQPVAELRPVQRVSVPPAELIARREHLPVVDPNAVRDDIDGTIHRSIN